MRHLRVVTGIVVVASLGCSGWFGDAAPEPAPAEAPPEAARTDLPSDPAAVALAGLEGGGEWEVAERPEERGRPVVAMGKDASLPDDIPAALPVADWTVQVVMRNGPSTTVVMEPSVDMVTAAKQLDAAVVAMGCVDPQRAGMGEARSMECYELPGWAGVSWQINPVGKGRVSATVQYTRTTPTP